MTADEIRLKFGPIPMPPIEIRADGSIYWHGRKVETDEDFRGMILEFVTLNLIAAGTCKWKPRAYSWSPGCCPTVTAQFNYSFAYCPFCGKKIEAMK